MEKMQHDANEELEAWHLATLKKMQHGSHSIFFF